MGLKLYILKGHKMIYVAIWIIIGIIVFGFDYYLDNNDTYFDIEDVYGYFPVIVLGWPIFLTIQIYKYILDKFAEYIDDIKYSKGK